MNTTMAILPQGFSGFLLRAKRATYSSNDYVSPKDHSSSTLHYEEADGWRYVNTCYGESQFAGEEIVWKEKIPIWAMNYCGRVIREGFSVEFLREALMLVPEDAPFRGPIEYHAGAFLYCNTCAGDPSWFFGREEIYKSGVCVFECVYHGGALK